jgi:hypothetical protein
MKICKLMREYGWDKFDIQLIEEIECQDKRELFWHEDAWRDTMRDAGYILTNTNRSIGLDSRMDYYRANPESYEKHLDRMKEKIACPDCGKMLTKNHMARHRRVCKHAVVY